MPANNPNPSPSAIKLTPVGTPLVGQITLPGSKSVTNRALLLAALAHGTSTLGGMLVSDDTRYMTEALKALGVDIRAVDDTTVSVSGRGQLRQPTEPLYLGNAGTAIRFLTAAAALVDGPVTLDGNAHMRQRPIGPLVQSLNAIGVPTRDTNGCPPVQVQGRGGFDATQLEIDGSLSSQYLSAMLMIAACGSNVMEIRIGGGNIGARGYIDITLAVMRAFGNHADAVSDSAWLIQPTGYQPRNYAIEPDASAATYFWAMEALTGGDIDLGEAAADMAQPDAGSKRWIRQFPNMSPLIDGSQMQDSIPTLAVLAAFGQAPVRFTGIENLRVKECDRIEALHAGLNAIKPGQACIEGDDLIVNGGLSGYRPEQTAQIDTYDDHRIAMSFALAALCLDNIAILNPNCVSKTFPEYWRCLESLGVQTRYIP